MKLFAAVFVLGMAPTLVTAVSAVGVAAPASAGVDISQPQAVNRASSHDRHHRRHTARIRHRNRHQVAKHRSQH